MSEKIKKIIGTLLYVVDGEKVLLGRKLRGFGTGKINGVGGKSQPGETIEETMYRETKEEFGIVPILPRYAGRLTYDEFFKGERVIFETHVFICEKFEGKLVATDEMEPIWFDKNNLPIEDMFGDDEFWLPQVLSGSVIDGFFKFDEEFNIIEKQVREI